MSSHRRVCNRLLWVVGLMFGFSFAMIPLYNTFCQITGLNGKTDGRVRMPPNMQVDPTRWIQVTFTTVVNDGFPWSFYSPTQRVQLHPGELRRIMFYAHNTSSHTLEGQAIPSVTPGVAARFLKKTECFCFERQTLEANQVRQMPVAFYLEPGLPADVREITLAYTMFDANRLLPGSWHHH